MRKGDNRIPALLALLMASECASAAIQQPAKPVMNRSLNPPGPARKRLDE